MQRSNRQKGAALLIKTKFCTGRAGNRKKLTAGASVLRKKPGLLKGSSKKVTARVTVPLLSQFKQ